MAESDERTRLLSNENRQQFSFNSSFARERKKRVKQFQCFLCAISLCLVILALIISIFFSMNVTFDDGPIPTSFTNNSAPNETLNLILSQTWPLEDSKLDNETSNNSTEWNMALLFGKAALDEKDNLETKIPKLPVDSPSYRHQTVTSTAKKALELSRIGYIEEHGRKYIRRNRRDDYLKICPNVTNLSLTDEFCENIEISCKKYERYRNYDGFCNNLNSPGKFGTAFQPFRRALPADYGDGISSPRLSKTGQALPTARTVSLIVHRPYYRDDNKFSVMLAVWGQFLDHDITATALSKNSNGSSISCCVDQTIKHPECFPVIIDDQDPLKLDNVTCMEFVRSAPAPTCCLGPREQLNQVTAFIDGSVIYGIEEPLVKELRTMKNGQMKMYVTKDNRTLLPVSENLNDGCNREEASSKGEYCFEAGDPRSNENIHLTSMHTLWARHHNKIAANLSAINPHWDDETLFQEARKIIGAQMQHITYEEFLPILLGPDIMSKFDLRPQQSGYFYKYNDSIDATIANHFAAAAFRFAHTIIPGIMKLLANDTSSPEFIQMHKMLFNPFKLYEPGGMDKIVRGAMHTNIEANDPYFTNELKQHLFERDGVNNTKPKKHGLDLVSLNIQRGRDHGLPGYIQWRKHCGFTFPRTFDDLKNYTDENSLNNIKVLYKEVDDVDLYTGALSEKPINGSILGPTLTCSILDQFIRIKYGDRYWYENPSERNNGFTLEQLDEIRQTSLAKIICENSDNVTYIQPKVMEKIREGNQNVQCRDLPGINLKFWKDPTRKIPMGDDGMKVRTPKPSE